MWKDVNNVPGIPDGKYEVSSEWQVKIKVKKRCLKPFKCRRYMLVKLCHFEVQKTISVHRLVASAFIPNPQNKPEVNHIDGNPANNCVENLEWVTKEENMAHAARTGLMPKGKKFGKSCRAKAVAAYTLEGDLLYVFSSGSEAVYAVSTGKSYKPTKVLAVCRGRRETAYGFQWRYVTDKGVETKISAATMTTNRRAQIERKDKDTFRSALLSYIAEKR